jgi:hypothetical protein
MANYIRTIVSGGKARFKDKELDIELGAHFHSLFPEHQLTPATPH